jgi:hypothetical protein
MSPLAVGPILAVVGILAIFMVMRGKARHRKSMYRSLRDSRHTQIQVARARAEAARTAIMEKETAAAAAAAAPPPAPSSTATVSPPPAVTPPPAAEPPAAEPPAYEAPAYEPPAEAPPAPPAPAPPRSGWEVVQPAAKEPTPAAAPAPSPVAASRASWELSTTERQKVDLKHKGKKGKDDGLDEEDEGKETLAQTVLSYAGLGMALLVVLLGIIFMIGAKAT